MKQLFYILSFTFLFANQSVGQSRAAGTDPGDRLVKTYPNPAQAYITFDMQANYKTGLTLKVFNGLLGKKMYETQNMSAKVTINLSNYSRGIYIYQLVDVAGKIVESGKFQVSN